jgi:transcriptional regulator with XRE-family HTH domain
VETGGLQTWEFGRTLRRWRDRVVPDDVGIPAGNRRRASGLRREELAVLAGISTDYLTRLEQGRATSPSAQVVDALARGLRVSDVERDLLFRLAGHAAPGVELMPTWITPSVQRLLDRLANTPVAVFDATNTLIVANASYDALMGDTSSSRGIERNTIWRHLVGSGSRAVHSPEEQADFEGQLVADLRMTASRYPADRSVRKLIKDLSAQSSRFVELWESDLPARLDEPSKHKTIDHPSVGRIALDCDALLVAGDDVRILVYTAEPGTEDAERLALAVVLGTQTLVD